MTTSPETLVRRVEGPRLVYYRSKADVAFWDEHWKRHVSPKVYERAEGGNLGWFEKPFTDYLPRNGLILEAGCGLGKYVLALRVRGYNVEGVEWSSRTVAAISKLYPNLPVRRGDVTQLDAPDAHYGGYISLGVLEHREEGPAPFLREAYRLLESGGVALISVPYFHCLRRLKGWLGFYRARPNGLEFYQYAFLEQEFGRILQTAGFRIIEKIPYNSFKGLEDEILMLPWIFKWRRIRQSVRRWLRSSKWAERSLGHMILFVCRKRS